MIDECHVGGNLDASGFVMVRIVLAAFIKAVLVVVGILALVGGGVCTNLNLAVRHNLIITGIVLLVAAGGWELLLWAFNRLRAKRQEEGTSPPHDRPHTH